MGFLLNIHVHNTDGKWQFDGHGLSETHLTALLCLNGFPYQSKKYKDHATYDPGCPDWIPYRHIDVAETGLSKAFMFVFFEAKFPEPPSLKLFRNLLA